MPFIPLTPENQAIRRGRILIAGTLGVGKTTAIVRAFQDLCAVNPDTTMAYLSFPGEKGYGSVPTLDGLTARIWEDASGIQSHKVIKEVEDELVRLMTLGPTILAGDGFHKLFCPTPSQRVLTRDLRWVPVGSLEVGDELIGFDEKIPAPYQSRRHRLSVVTAVTPTEAEVFRLHLSGGVVLEGTAEHPWLVTRHRTGYTHEWRPTKRLQIGERFPRFFYPWTPDRSYEAGWLAGIFDGEGSVGRYKDARGAFAQMHLGFAQKPGVILDAATEWLRARNFVFSSTLHKSGCASVQIFRKADMAWLLGAIRPRRLLPKITPEWLGSLKGIREHAVLEHIEPLGVREVIQLGTSTGTFFQEGFGSHNSYILDAVTDGAYFQGDAFEQRLYGRAYTVAGDMLSRMFHSKVPLVFISTWVRGRAERNAKPGEQARDIPQKLYPDFPPGLARVFVGEFDVAVMQTLRSAPTMNPEGLYAPELVVKLPQKEKIRVWQTRTHGEVEGVTLKAPVNVSKRIPTFIPASYSALMRIWAEAETAAKETT